LALDQLALVKQYSTHTSNQATVKPMTAEVVGLIMLPHPEEAKK